MDHQTWIEEGLLGEGTYGSVYLYACGSDKRAVKKFKVNQQDCKKEIDIALTLQHRNIVKSFPTPLDFRLDNVLFMEFTDLGNLKEKLKEAKFGFDERTVRDVIRDLVEGVNYLHNEKQIAHRDIKPANILICRDLQGPDDAVIYKLADLGMAKDAEPDQSMVSVYVGTRAYWAPEQNANYEIHQENYWKEEQKQKISHRRTVDYWALGVICHECITGIRPFGSFEEIKEFKGQVHPEKDNVICITKDFKGACQRSETICLPHRLCRISVPHFSQFMQKMLRYDKLARGGSSNDWYGYFTKTVLCDVVVIYVVQTQSIVSYPQWDTKESRSYSIREIIKAAAQEGHLLNGKDFRKIRKKLKLLRWNGRTGEEIASTSEPVSKYKFCFKTQSPCLFLFLLDGKELSTRINDNECKYVTDAAGNTSLLKYKENFLPYAHSYVETKRRHVKLLVTAWKALCSVILEPLPLKTEKVKLLEKELSHVIGEYDNEVTRYEALLKLPPKTTENSSTLQKKVIDWRSRQKEHKTMEIETCNKIGEMEKLNSLDKALWNISEDSFVVENDWSYKTDPEDICKDILEINKKFEEFVKQINEKMQQFTKYVCCGVNPETVEENIKTVKQHLTTQRDDIHQVIMELMIGP